MNIIWQTFLSNPEYYILGGIAIAEAITRITPTKKDDGFVQRIGGFIKMILDGSKIPNRKKPE